MVRLIVYKDKITITKWEEQSGSWGEFDIYKLEGSIAKYFNKIVEIKPDVTIQNFINHLEKYEPIIDLCFSDYLKNIPIRNFVHDMNKAEAVTDFGEVELYWEGEIINDDLSITGYLRAWPKNEKIKELGEEYEIPYDVSLLPIYTWKNCNFILNENIIVNDLSEMSSLKKDVVFSGFYRWTLFEVISHFLAEISANGSPDDRDRIFIEMEGKRYNLKEIVKSKEQTDFWLAFLEQELIDLNKLMDSASESEEYEKASKIKVDIADTEKELFELREELKKNGIKL